MKFEYLNYSNCSKPRICIYITILTSVKYPNEQSFFRKVILTTLLLLIKKILQS